MVPIILFSVLLIYVLFIGLLIFGFTKVDSFENSSVSPKTKFTIIVPFRDESENLPQLLNSFSKLNYPKDLFEVILVDDFSKERIRFSNFDFQISILQNNRVSNSPKKDAISTAIKFVKTDWIITTEADCTVSVNWLETLDNYIQNHVVSMIAGAVTYNCANSFLHYFQQLDLASLQGATIGSFGIEKGFMCNGANFAYTKSFFQELNGFEGNDTIISGDDLFLLQKAIARFSEKVHYLKSENNVVFTKPVDDWKSLFHKRVRWASKMSSYQSSFGIGLGLVVFGGNLALALSVVCWILGFLPFQNIVFLFFFKFSVDSILIYKTNRFLTKQKIRFLILSSLIYPFFSTSVAFYSFFGKYEWKGRKF